jgi:hypothetical protein
MAQKRTFCDASAMSALPPTAFFVTQEEAGAANTLFAPWRRDKHQ